MRLGEMFRALRWGDGWIARRHGMARIFFLLLLLLLATSAFAEDRKLSAGFEHFYNLEYPQALTEFRAEAAREPNSPDAYNHIAQTILYREMFRSGALESQMVTGNNAFLRREKLNPSATDEKEFDDSLNRAFALAQARLNINPKDVGALYAKGVSFGLRSNYRYLVRKAWTDGLRDATDARKAHNRATELDPNFVDATLVQGLYDYMVGSLPFTYRILGFVAGYHGDKERGIATLKQVYEHGLTNNQDAAVILCVIYRRERRAQDAVPLLSHLIDRFPRNFLLRLELVQMYADLGEKDKAMTVIAQVNQLKRTHAAGYDELPEEKLRYTRGNLLFWYNDLDTALDDMKFVTARADAVELNTGVYAWLRLGQIYDLKGMRREATSAYHSTISYAPGSDAAHQAEDFLSSRYKR